MKEFLDRLEDLLCEFSTFDLAGADSEGRIDSRARLALVCGDTQLTTNGCCLMLSDIQSFRRELEARHER
tara:strand:+ start:6130 stop:6339 length:210 start_codon:yes stop_codon:yes gene_type:complete